MKPKYIYIAIISALILLNIATLATLWFRPMGPPPPDRHRTGDFLVRELKFDKQQAEQFRKLRDAHFQNARELDHQIHENKRRMLEVLAQNPPDTAAAFAITQSTGKLTHRLDSLLVQHYLDIQAICTPEQREKLKHVFMEAMPKPEGPPKGRRSRE